MLVPPTPLGGLKDGMNKHEKEVERQAIKEELEARSSKRTPVFLSFGNKKYDGHCAVCGRLSCRGCGDTEDEKD